MDKPNRNKTITIKINGNEEAYIKERNKEKESKQKEEDEISPLVIESAASKETSDESFDWVIPSQEVQSFEKESLFVSSNKKKNNNKNERLFQKLFISIIAAVLIGAGFWYIVFQTITAKEKSTVNTVAPLEGNTGGGQGQVAAANLVPIQLFFVQGGVFSNREAAVAAKDEFIEKGFPAIVISDGDKSYVALFASDSLENAKAVATTYKDQGIDVYWKEMVISPGGEVKLSNDDVEIVAASAALYQSLIGAATQLKLASGQIDDNQLETKLNELLEMEVNDESVAKMVISLKDAVETALSGDAAEKNQLQMQTQILQFISMYNQLASN